MIFCKKALELVHIISKWKPGIICILAIKLIYPDYKSDMLSTDYNPFQWPPNLQLAKLHYDASKSGTDKPDGQRCPCCNRQEKQPNNTWFMRNIREDFKRYGGGIPGFFYLLLYVLTVMFILGVFNVIYHIMLLDEVCPTLKGTSDSCALVFGVFYFCEHDVLSDTLQGNG